MGYVFYFALGHRLAARAGFPPESDNDEIGGASMQPNGPAPVALTAFIDSKFQFDKYTIYLVGVMFSRLGDADDIGDAGGTGSGGLPGG